MGNPTKTALIFGAVPEPVNSLSSRVPQAHNPADAIWMLIQIA
jgi:hypothetical protein